MTATPWGDVQRLEDLEQVVGDPPERAPELAARPPRERIYAAMTAGCAERGFDSITIDDLVRLSGTSRETFYELFENKAACFVETLETTLEGVVETLARGPLSNGTSPEGRVRGALSQLIDLAATQRAAAHLCMVEPYTVGSEALGIIRAAFERMQLLAKEAIEELPGREGIPNELSQAIAGGIYQVLYHALLHGQDLRALEEPLWDWALSYPPPSQPLRVRGRRPKLPPPDAAPPYGQVDPAERIIRGFAKAVAEKGYRATTVSDIAARASISQRTFYEHFENKNEVLTAAIDSSGMQMLAAALPAIRRSPGWPESVRAATAATTQFLATEPDFAWLRQVEIYATGPEALALRDAAGLEILAEAIGDADIPEVHPVARQALVGAVYSIYVVWITTRGTDSLPEMSPLLTYVMLAPFVGAERACEIAVDARSPAKARADAA